MYSFQVWTLYTSKICQNDPRNESTLNKNEMCTKFRRNGVCCWLIVLLTVFCGASSGQIYRDDWPIDAASAAAAAGSSRSCHLVLEKFRDRPPPGDRICEVKEVRTKKMASVGTSRNQTILRVVVVVVVVIVFLPPKKCKQT